MYYNNNENIRKLLFSYEQRIYSSDENLNKFKSFLFIYQVTMSGKTAHIYTETGIAI